jgi:hypothetical protein
MKIDRFDPPANVADFTDAGTLQRWSDKISRYFDHAVTNVSHYLAQHGGGTCQFYNPLTHGLADTDTFADITWNGFPRAFSNGPGGNKDFQGAEPAINPGDSRPQDEYLEWHVTRDGQGRIISVHFTCEGPDYYGFLAKVKPDLLVDLYRKHINQAVQLSDLMQGGEYDPNNKWNSSEGAMHLGNPPNNLFAEVELGAEATVRRQRNNVELTDPGDLIDCGQHGERNRNSDPTIGAGVNALAQKGMMITLKNPVGLYIDSFDDSGIQQSDGTPVPDAFVIQRGKPGQILRVEFRVPTPLANQGVTVSDLTIGGTPINFGGQLAELFTIKLTGAACRAGSVKNKPTGCGGVPNVAGNVNVVGALAVARKPLPVRRTGR